MYGLPQAGILANKLLKQRLAKHGYYECKHTPGLWKHRWRPITFVLVVDDYGVKYHGRKHALHLAAALKQHYEVTMDWTGSLYIGISLHWDYANSLSTSQCQTTSKKPSNVFLIQRQNDPKTHPTKRKIAKLAYKYK